MRFFMRNAALISILEGAAQLAWPQGQQPPRTPPPAPAPPYNARPYLPVCSTEKVNGDCSFNIDRNYPITLPTFQMKRGAHVSVYVFHPYTFELLTLDAGTASAFESSDQVSALVTAAGPVGKGAVLGLVESGALNETLMADADFTDTAASARTSAVSYPQGDQAQRIIDQITGLGNLLTQATAPLPDYFGRTRTVYCMVREIESAQPRPTADVNGTLMRGACVPPNAPAPWTDFPAWRAFIVNQVTTQGEDTTAVLDRLPQPCQPPGTGAATGPWLPSPRPCTGSNTGIQVSNNPFAIDPSWDGLYQTLTQGLNAYSNGPHDAATLSHIQTLKSKLDNWHQRVLQGISAANGLLPSLIAKISPDMQTVLANVNAIRTTLSDPTFLGVIPPPPAPTGPNDPEKVMAPNKALAPQITYMVNAQNEIGNSLLSLPAATQKQPLATITVLYASPRFEMSSGVFFSFLPNRTFSNVTDTAVTAGVPASLDVRIQQQKTDPPLVIPFVAANYRLSDEFTWLGKRRGAIYATLGLAGNPYNAQVEYIGGLTFSWRFLTFGPLAHLGHDTYLTQGEKPNQIWCVYGTPAMGGPPACTGGPPAPSTKMYWTGAFAFQIGVRVPTTFSATNH
jgi:hypothetical protein